ncbi:GNAT family N-acetyltransferase [Mangrovihabitans endophyticus]|uniref:GNAT family N-acetyltransferase n=1 Tax=Mangrovihabitans endophyticus TaxID=1751298 RepID=A0A8J3C4S9_9ACTN|nr:GNAT family N-acetyltransferase [Mangrovihabitans endophyticus]GGL10402.1 GNAT family N-acetyltransferase [Mangrovihabitans endophyticus]
MTVDIAFLSRTDADDVVLVRELIDLVNEVYADAEKGLWVDGATRISATEMTAAIRAGEIVAARRGTRIVGLVQVRRLPTGEGEFGMLVAAPDQRGAGVGRRLVAYAEDWARSQGCGTMQLELLVPHSWTHPFKEFLLGWYTRAGYRQIRSENFATAYPRLARDLATECDFLVYHKALSGT